MTKRVRNLLDKNTMRDALTNKRIGNNKEVIIVSNAFDYVKKQGYLVMKPQRYSDLLVSCFVILTALIILSNSVLALDSVSSYDKNKNEITLKNPLTLDIESKYTLLKTLEGIINLEMYGESTLYKTSTLFDGVAYKNIFNEYTTLKKGNYYILKTKNSLVPDEVKTICNEVLNISTGKTNNVCYDEVLNYKTVSNAYGQWELYKNELLPQDTYKWKFAGERSLNQTVDVQPIKSGVEFKQWIWFNNDWTNRKLINISSGVSNYTILYNVTWVNPMSTNFSDLRFTDYIGNTEIPYYIINYTSGVNCNIAFKVDLNATQTYVYMYYGNPTVETTSNIKTAFLVGDDFADGIIDTAIWNISGTLAEANGYVNWTNSGNLISKLNFSISDGLIIKFITATPTANTDQLGMSRYGDVTASATQGKVGIREYNSGGNQGYMVSQLGSNNIGVASGTLGQYHTYQCYMNSSTQSCTRLDTGGVLTYTGTVNTTLPVSASFYMEASKKSIGNVTMRKFASPEPITTTGSAEVLVLGDIYINSTSPINNSNVTSLAVDFRCNVTSAQGYSITSIRINVTNINWTSEITGLSTKSYNASFLNSTLPNGNYTYYCMAFGDYKNTTSNLTYFSHEYYLTAPSTIFTFDLSTQPNILIFIIMLVVSVVVLIFVNWTLGCVFLLICGMIPLINSKLLLGIMLIIASVVLMFMKGSDN